MKKFATLFLLLTSFSLDAVACPPGCGFFSNYLVIVESGFERDAVLTQGRALATKLKSEFVDGGDFQARIEKCNSDPSHCLLFLSSEDEGIGKESYNPSKGEKAPKTTFAVAYYFVGTGGAEAHYLGRKKEAKATLARIREQVKEAYLKPIPQCSCE